MILVCLVKKTIAAENFNKYFVDVGKTLANKLPYNGKYRQPNGRIECNCKFREAFFFLKTIKIT